MTRKTMVITAPPVARQFSGENLRRVREAAGVRREDLCTATGCGFSSLYGWEMGRSAPGANKLVRLADVLNVPLDDLFTNVTPARRRKN